MAGRFGLVVGCTVGAARLAARRTRSLVHVNWQFSKTTTVLVFVSYAMALIFFSPRVSRHYLTSNAV